MAEREYYDSKKFAKYGFQFKYWTFKDKSLLEQLLLRNKNKKHKIKRIFWTLFENPMGEGFFITIQLNDTIVGHNYGYPRIICYKGKNIKVLETGESFVDPNHRKKGFFSKMVNYTFNKNKNIPLIIGTPNRGTVNANKRMNYVVSENKTIRFLSYFPKDIEVYLKKDKILKITRKKYIEKTVDFPRLCVANQDYLNWVFSRPNVTFEFYEVNIKKKQLIFALRSGLPGLRKINILSESFSNGQKAGLVDCCDMIDFRNFFKEQNSEVIFNANINGYTQKYLKSKNLYLRDTWFNYVCLDNKFSELYTLDYQLTDTDYG